MNTLLLDTVAWDLVLDVKGDIAVASNPYSLAQDAASACRLFSGELWYDTTQGVPYFGSILGFLPSLTLLKKTYVNAGLTVPEVKSANCFLNAISVKRVLSGQVQVTSTTGATAAANF